MGKSRHGGKHFMERGKSNKKGFKRPNQDESQDWRKSVRNIPEENS